MKILLISTSVVPLLTGRYGGVEKLLVDFAEQLIIYGHSVSIAAPEGSHVPAGCSHIQTVDLPEDADNDLAAYECYGHLVADYDVVHDFSHKQILSKRQPDKPVLNMIWDPLVTKYDRAPYNAVCLSKWQAERFRRVYGRETRLGGLCVNTEKYTIRPETTDRIRYLFLGKISPEKGVHLAIQLAKTCNLELDVVGGLIPSEYDSPYVSRIAGLCDDVRTVFHWNVSEEEKIRFLQEAKAVIYPVEQEEAHWLVGVEAWACGTPTFALDRGSMSEIIRPSCGVVSKGLSEMIRSLSVVGGFDRYAIRRYAETDYSRSVVVSRYLQIYQDVARGARW